MAGLVVQLSSLAANESGGSAKVLRVAFIPAEQSILYIIHPNLRFVKSNCAKIARPTAGYSYMGICDELKARMAR